MRTARCLCTMAMSGLFLVAVGCGKPQSDMAMEMSKGPPPRPMELDKLDHMVGNWDDTYEMKMGDKTMTGKGTSRAEWQCDKLVVVQYVDGEMQGAPGKFHGMGLYTWDPHGRVYHSFWLDNAGHMGHGEMTFDEATKTWNSKEKGENTMTGAHTSGRSSMKVVDNNTIEWNGTEYGGFMGMTKQMEMKGTSKRRM